MPAHFLRRIVIVSVQLIILAFSYGFLGAVLYYGALYPPDRVANLWKNYPQELTMVVTLIATVLSVATAILFTASVKDALRHRMSQPISLIELTAGVALSKGSYILRPEYLRLTSLTLFLFVVLRLLTAGWTTLLTPVYFSLPITMQGSELDITGNAFNTMLYGEYQAQGFSQIRNDAFEVLDIGGMLSGISAAGQTYGLPGTFNFNGAKYNVSTGGIVPTIEDYSGSDGAPCADCTRLAFSGGNVTVNTGPILGKHSMHTVPQGFGTNYSMWQQGYTWNPNNSQLVYTNATASNDSLAGLRLWNIVGNCGADTSITQNYVTMVNASGDASPSSGFLPSIVCPGPMNLSQTYTSFAILLQGFNKYNFLDASVCEVTPLLTIVRANYANDLISSSDIISSNPFRSENVQVLSFIAGVAKFQSISSQGLVSSTIGDTLYSIYSSTTNTTIGDGPGNQTQVYKELEDYWRGVVEFSATFLRSGFMAQGSFYNNTIPLDLQSTVDGTMYVWMIGWTRRSAAYLLAIIPITITSILTFGCVLYSHLLGNDSQAGPKNGSRTTFDVSNTLHLIMASVAGILAPQLENFDKDMIIGNERVKVQLKETGDHGEKKFLEVI
ncbi:hypothetical protein BDR07DRAFT_1493738 [Suillus spraguei]|nr:hypothetical protein BDR07DRAFT_1493738 [Suillus spraguei]